MKEKEIIDEISSGPKREPDVIRRTRILHVKDYLEKYTDAERSASMYEILKYLDNQGIPAERKSVRDDIVALREYGLDIELENGKQWKLLSRDFDLVEIKLIIDCIASSKFLSEKKSKELIGKIETLISSHQRWLLNRGVFVPDRSKSMNEGTLYALDTIYEALEMHGNSCIDFKYYQYNMDKIREYKHEGKTYHVYPRRLVYDNNTYYLLANEGKELKTFRVDRMTSVKLTEIAEDDEFDFSSSIDTASLVKSTFGMFYGDLTEVKLLFHKSMMDTVIDRFGEDVDVEKVDDNHFRVKTKVAISPQFYGWIFGLGENVMIEYPLAVAKQMKDMLKERHKAYREEHSWNLYSATYQSSKTK